MTSSTRDWVDKAEADYPIAAQALRSRKKYSRDVACFLFQQCAEKYLKGRMVEGGILFPKTHDLEKLLDMLLPVEPLWVTLRPAVAAIKHIGVEVRYPGNTTTSADARNLKAAATRVREFVRVALGLR